MRKSDKKLDNQLRRALTNVCESALKDVPGFQWLTHLVDFTHFPQSLRVVCIFDTIASLNAFKQSASEQQLLNLIHAELYAVGVTLKNISHHVTYDTEESCQTQHNGKWASRFASLSS